MSVYVKHISSKLAQIASVIIELNLSIITSMCLLTTPNIFSGFLKINITTKLNMATMISVDKFYDSKDLCRGTLNQNQVANISIFGIFRALLTDFLGCKSEVRMTNIESKSSWNPIKIPAWISHFKINNTQSINT